MKRFLILFFSALISLISIVSIAWSQFYGPAVEDECVIYLSNSVLNGDNNREKIIDSLIIPHIKHHNAFKIYSKRLNLVDGIKAGRYEFKTGMSVIDVVRMLKIGVQSPVTVTFNNIRLMEELAGRISKQIDCDSLSLLGAITSEDLASEFGFTPIEMQAIYIPNSYQMWWTSTPEDFVRRMKREYDAFWTQHREAARKELGMSRAEVTILASIVNEESAKVDEMARIAGVYINRLNRGEKLQSDPTVRYGIGDFTMKRILFKDLEYDSPYNTYIYVGLPPGPISIPSIAAIDGVLNYEKHNYLFFCARPELDGYHNFAVTYSQHLANARQYSAELNKRGIK